MEGEAPQHGIEARGVVLLHQMDFGEEAAAPDRVRGRGAAASPDCGLPCHSSSGTALGRDQTGNCCAVS
jgi:hypothetical protein